MSETVTRLPGKYRVFFKTDHRAGPFYLDVEIKTGKPRAFVRGFGPDASPEAVARFSKQQVYLDSLYPGCRPQFHGSFKMVHEIERVEPLPRA